MEKTKAFINLPWSYASLEIQLAQVGSKYAKYSRLNIQLILNLHSIEWMCFNLSQMKTEHTEVKRILLQIFSCMYSSTPVQKAQSHSNEDISQTSNFFMYGNA